MDKAAAADIDVLVVAQQLEAVDVRHVAFLGDDVSRFAEVRTEVAVASRDHAPDEFAVVLVVEEADHLRRHGAAVLVVDGRPSPVGRADEAVGLIDNQRLVVASQGNTLAGKAQLVHETLGVSGG